MAIETTKLDELLRKLPRDSGLDPRLVEGAKTELEVLKFQAGAQTKKQKSWSKSDVTRLEEELKEKDTEILLLKRQLQNRSRKLNSRGTNPGTLNTPSQIKDRYTDMYDNEWSLVYDYFADRGWNDIEIIVTLQRILRASYAFCKDVADEQLDNIEGEALYPSASWMDDTGIINRTRQTKISREIRQLAKVYQRTTSMECLSALQKTFRAEVMPTFVDPSQYDDAIIKDYAKHCVEISWSMCVQDPPMTFIDKIKRGSDFDEELFQKYIKTSSNKFDFLVWPAMRLEANGPIIVKGVAQAIRISQTPTGSVKSMETPRDSPSRASQLTSVSRSDARSVGHTPRDRGGATPKTPPRLYKQATPRDNNAMPSSPYFAPNTGTPRQDRQLPKITVVGDDRSVKSEMGNHPNNDLTVVWKKEKDEQRIMSAF